MGEKLAFAVVASVFMTPVAIFVAEKMFPRLSRFVYPAVGVVCLVVAAGFFAFVGGCFIETGQLVSPGKYNIPARIVGPEDPLAGRILTAAFNLGIGLTLAIVGIAMLRVKRK